MCSELIKPRIYNESMSNQTAVNALKQQKFLTQLLEKCEQDFAAVQADLEGVRAHGKLRAIGAS